MVFLHVGYNSRQCCQTWVWNLVTLLLIKSYLPVYCAGLFTTASKSGDDVCVGENATSKAFPRGIGGSLELVATNVKLSPLSVLS